MNKSFECPHFPRCSGCSQTQHVDQPPILNEVASFFSDHGFPDFKLHVGSVTGWRNRAKLAVRGTAQIPLIGLYRAGSHDVINIPFCKVHHPKINEAVNLIKTWIRENQIAPYNETDGTGVLRYLQLTVQKKSGKVQLVLVINDKEISETLTALLQKLNDPLWHSIWINLNERRDNVLFGNEWTHFKGDPWLWESVAGTDICFHPSSFMQGNLEAFEALVQKIKEAVIPNQNVAEYYAGVGVIGLCLAEQSNKVVCSEINTQAETCFYESKKRLGKKAQESLRFKGGPSRDHLEFLKESDVVIVDPPRKGIEKQLLASLLEPNHVKKLIYVSCGWDGFKKDCHALIEGGWKIESCEGYLFFPGTDQIETLIMFARE